MNFFSNLFTGKTAEAEKEKLTSFHVQKAPTFNEICDLLSKELITGTTLDKVFEKCCFITVDSFFEKYMSTDTLKCQHAPITPEWFFTCKECSVLEAGYYCSVCFFGSKHAGHEFKMIENSIGRVCDCGNEEALKKEGFCSYHSNVDEKTKKERFDKVPLFVKKDIHIFFRYLLQYIQKISALPQSTAALSDPSVTTAADVEGDINVICNWSIIVLKVSSIVTHIIAEEMAAKVLEYSNGNEIKLYDNKQIPFKTDEELAAGEQWGLTNKSQSFLSHIFSNPSLLFKVLPLIGPLIDNHAIFRAVVFEEFVKNYATLFKTRDTTSSDIFITMHTYYLGSGLLAKFSTGFSRYNYIEQILKSHKNYYVPLLLPFYQTRSAEDIKQEVMLQTDTTNIPKLMKLPEVVKYYVKEEEKFKLIFELAESLHKFTTLQYVDPSISTTKFLLNMEHSLTLSVRNIITTIQKENDDKLLEFVTNSIAEKLVSCISTLKKRSMTNRCGMMLPHDDFFKNFTYAEIPVHYPLYRILSSFLLITGMDPKLLTTKYYMTEEEVVEMASTVLLFRFCYVTYDPQDTVENCTDISMTFDLHILQVSLLLLGPKKFLLTFYNIMSSIDNDSNPNALRDNFALIISTLQLRPTLTPTVEEIYHHLYQGAFSGIFSKIHFRSFDYILIGATENDICDTHVPNITTSGNEKYLLDLDNWKYYDPYYPYFCLNYRQLITTNQVKKLKEYQASKLKYPFTKSRPLPPITSTLSKQMEGIFEIYNDPYYYETIFTILLQILYPTSNGYEGSFELHSVFKKLLKDSSIVINEFIYLLDLGIKSFKEVFLPSLKDTEKQEIIKSVNDYLTAEDKLGFTFTGKQNVVFSLLSVHNVNLGTADEKVKLSLLDLIFKFWKSLISESKYEEQSLSLFFVLNTLLEFDQESFTKLFSDNGVNIDDVNKLNKDKDVNVVLDSLSNLDIKQEDVETETKVEETETKVEETETKVEETETKVEETEIKVEETKVVEKSEEFSHNETSPCVCCNKVDDKLYAMSYIDLSSLPHQNSMQRLYKIVEGDEDEDEDEEDEDETEKSKPTDDDKYDQRYKDFLKTFYLTDIKPADTQFIPYKDDPAGLFACYLFLRSPSTYISSCQHNVHIDCWNSKLKSEAKDGTPIPTSFRCPKCASPWDLFIPTFQDDGSNEYKVAADKLFTDLCYFDFLTLMDKENKYSVDKYLWKFVLQNIETLEIKSRTTTLYNDNEDDEPYGFITESDFQKELKTTYQLFSVINDAAEIDPEPILPIYDQSTFFVDPFTSSSYSIFLANSQHANLITHGLSLYLFNCFIHHCIKEKVVPEKDVENSVLVTKLVTDEFNRLFYTKLDDGTYETLDDETFEEFNSVVRPYIGKFLILQYFIVKSLGGDLTAIPHPTLELLRDDEPYIEGLGIKSLEDLMRRFLTKEYFDMSFSIYMNKKKVSATISSVPTYFCSFPPPQHYEHLPKFVEFEENFMEATKENILGGNCETCKKITRSYCIVCSRFLCVTPQCKGSNTFHIYACSYPCGFFQQVNSPIINAYLMQHGTFRISVQSSIYVDKKGKKSKEISEDITLSMKKVRKIYKNYINPLTRGGFQDKLKKISDIK